MLDATKPRFLLCSPIKTQMTTLYIPAFPRISSFSAKWFCRRPRVISGKAHYHLCPPQPTPPRAQASAHQYYWVTRSLRKSTCSACGRDILGRTYRVVYEPNPQGPMAVEDRGRCRAVFWLYYHIARACLGHLTRPLPEGQLPFEIAPLPKESDDARAAATAVVVAQLWTEFAGSRAATSGSGAAA